MQKNKTYLRYTWFVVLMVFLVILAGGVVRMTQSGMGSVSYTHLTLPTNREV